MYVSSQPKWEAVRSMAQDMAKTAWRQGDHVVTHFKVDTILGLANSAVACAYVSCIVLYG
jgi:hypothetical protein